MKRVVLLAVFALMGLWASAQVATTTNDVPLQDDVEAALELDGQDYEAPDFDINPKDTPIPPPLYIYPNPTANKVTVNTDNQVAQIDVYNTQGNKFLTVYNANSAELRNLPAGSYIFTVTMADGTTYTYTVVRR